MNKLFCFISVALCILAISNLAQAKVSVKDDVNRSLIVGIWEIVITPDALFEKKAQKFKKKGLHIKGSYMEREFIEDGTFLIVIYDSPDKKKAVSTIEGKWWVQSGNLFIYPYKVNSKETVFRKKPYVEKIIHISEDEMTLRTESGYLYRNKKIKR